jgi:type IV secretory pathway TraG/TraD family ATPase VirD4
MGILAGYGINFYIVVQGLNQIIDIYGQNHTFLDNCKTVMVFAPGKIEDARAFTEMIGKESVLKDSLSASGSRYGVSLNNLNTSSQEVARDLMNPDELIKLPPNEALILNQGMPAYIAKKICYYEDSRFKDKAYSSKTGTGFPPPASRQELEKEIACLPSFQKTQTASVQSVSAPSDSAAAEQDAFNPVDFIASYQEDEVGFQRQILRIADIEMENPPKIMEFMPDFQEESQ